MSMYPDEGQGRPPFLKQPHHLPRGPQLYRLHLNSVQTDSELCKGRSHTAKTANNALQYLCGRLGLYSVVRKHELKPGEDSLYDYVHTIPTSTWLTLLQ